MINQPRKEWGFACQLFEQLLVTYPDMRFWMHVDTAIRAWNVHALIADYHLADHLTVTTSPQTDTWLIEQYKQCALTLLPSSEGFGYAWLESFACDIPCLHPDYAGGASMMRTCGLERYLVPISGLRVEGQFNCMRPILSLDMWLYKIGWVMQEKREAGDLANAIEHLRWKNISGRWLSWFHEGLGQ